MTEQTDSQPKHTPGPWREGWDYSRISKCSAHMRAYAVGPHHSCIGAPVGDTDILQPDKATMEKVFADARLIAAAPDMLAALEALSAPAKWQNAPHELIRQAEAAIAKATGATP